MKKHIKNVAGPETGNMKILQMTLFWRSIAERHGHIKTEVCSVVLGTVSATESTEKYEPGLRLCVAHKV